MAAVLMCLALLLAKEFSAVSAADKCTSSSDLSMSAGFLPAALAALSPLGIGSCSNSNTTCDTSLGACPSSSCCISPNDPNGGTCGCSHPSQGGTETCADPKSLAIDLVACNADGSPAGSNIQISFLSRGAKCVEGVTVEQVVSSNGASITQITANICNSQRSNEQKNRSLSDVDLLLILRLLGI